MPFIITDITGLHVRKQNGSYSEDFGDAEIFNTAEDADAERIQIESIGRHVRVIDIDEPLTTTTGILQQLRSLAGSNSNEDAHREADSLLCSALRLAAGQMPESSGFALIADEFERQAARLWYA